MKKPIDKDIFLVGYPKSGNTWIIRLLSKTLNIRVKEKPMNANVVDLASEVNREIQPNSDAKIHKIHYQPEDFLKYVDTNPKYIIYLHRDIRDVVVSSFFYFEYHDDQNNALRAIPIKNIFNPYLLYKHFIARKWLNRFVPHLINRGHASFGKWQEHITEWRKYLEMNKNTIKTAYTSYENFVENPCIELTKILHQLELLIPRSTEIAKIVNEENFGNLKNKYSEIADNNGSDDTDYYKYFFREGRKGNWKNYLNSKQTRFILYNTRKEMEDLDYI